MNELRSNAPATIADLLSASADTELPSRDSSGVFDRTELLMHAESVMHIHISSEAEALLVTFGDLFDYTAEWP